MESPPPAWLQEKHRNVTGQTIEGAGPGATEYSVGKKGTLIGSIRRSWHLKLHEPQGSLSVFTMQSGESRVDGPGPFSGSRPQALHRPPFPFPGLSGCSSVLSGKADGRPWPGKGLLGSLCPALFPAGHPAVNEGWSPGMFIPGVLHDLFPNAPASVPTLVLWTSDLPPPPGSLTCSLSHGSEHQSPLHFLLHSHLSPYRATAYYQ